MLVTWWTNITDNAYLEKKSHKGRKKTNDK